jgi:hypothetical protein
VVRLDSRAVGASPLCAQRVTPPRSQAPSTADVSTSASRTHGSRDERNLVVRRAVSRAHPTARPGASPGSRCTRGCRTT